MGLIKAPTEPPPDATDTERLMAAAGRTVRPLAAAVQPFGPIRREQSGDDTSGERHEPGGNHFGGRVAISTTQPTNPTMPTGRGHRRYADGSVSAAALVMA